MVQTRNERNVAIIGFGYIGSVIGAVLAQSGYSVVGIDRDKDLIRKVNAGQSPFNEPGLEDLIRSNVQAGRLRTTDDISTVRGCSVILITVGTPLSDSGEPDMEQIVLVAQALAPHLSDDQLIILKSTVPPWTTEQLLKPVFEKTAKVLLAFCPERIAEGNAIKELTHIPVIVGGVDEKSASAAAEFWEAALGVKTIIVHSARTAEMVKLADNLWIDLNIALANEIAQLSDKLEIDVLEVIHAANTLPKVNYNVNILLPSVGVGGYCLTKDPWFVHYFGKSHELDLQIPRVSRAVNDRMPYYAASLIKDALLNGDVPSRKHSVAVLGIAFKNNTGDCRFTPTKHVIAALNEHGFDLRICDPLVSEKDAQTVTSMPLIQDMEEALKGADAVVFLTGHRIFHEFPLVRLAQLLRPGALVFDGRMFFPREKINEIKALGL